MKKLIALLLAVLMAASLVACGSAPADPAAPSEPGAADAAPAADAPVEAPAEDPVDAPANTTISLPLTTEPVTFEGWLSGSFQIADESNTLLQDSPAYDWIEAQTGVHVELTVEPSATANEKFNLMIVSEDYPDYIYYNQSYYIGGMAKYIEDEIIVDLAPYMDQYAPNYQAIRMSDESVRRATMLDGGMIPGFYRILTQVQNSWLGPLIRADWLEDEGLASPKALDEWTNVLTAFSAREDCVIPYAFSSDGNDRALLVAYDLPENAKIYPIDGVMQYRYASENFRQYLTQANAWYQAGLLSANFYGENYSWDTGVLANGEIGATNGMAAFTDTVRALSNGAVRFEGAQAPTLEAGGKRIAAQVGSCSERVEAVLATITTACENVPLLVQYFDFIYSDAAAEFAIYGIEGETYTVDASGKCVFTDFVRESNYTVTALMSHYSIYNSLPFCNDPQSQYQLSTDTALACFEAWDGNIDYDNMIVMPEMISLTAEEAEEYASIISDIDTYVAENIIRFITGEKSMNDFDSFVDTLYSMDLQGALDIYQAAYDRYMAR